MSEQIEIRRATRGDLADIAALVNKAARAHARVDEADVREWLFSKGLMVAIMAGTLVGVVAWQTENLLSVTDVFYVAPAKLRAEAGGRLLAAVEAEVNTLMCEANVLLLPQGTPKALRTFLQKVGYEPQEFGELHRIWREVLSGFDTREADILVKRLRERMVMAPI